MYAMIIIVRYMCVKFASTLSKLIYFLSMAFKPWDSWDNRLETKYVPFCLLKQLNQEYLKQSCNKQYFWQL